MFIVLDVLLTRRNDEAAAALRQEGHVSWLNGFHQRSVLTWPS